LVIGGGEKKWRVTSNWWLVALNLPKAQLDLGMPVELWSVDSRSVAERAADSVGLAKSCLRPYPQSWPWFLHYSREMEVAAEIKIPHA
jgi:hypothetical protein